MGKNKNKNANVQTKKEENKQTAKPAVSNKPVEKKEVKKPEEKIETAEVTVVDKTSIQNTFIKEALEGTESSFTPRGLSPDAASMLAYTIQRKYFDNPKASKDYSQSFLSNMSAIQDGIIVGIVIDEVVKTNSAISMVIRKASYPQLQAIAGDYGIKLPKVQHLSLPTKEEMEAMKQFGIKEEEDGQLSIPFTPEDVNSNVKKQLQNEAKSAAKDVEMDPKKITTEDGAADALAKIYANRNIKGKINIILLDAIKFVKDYRYAEAERKNDDKLRAILDSRTIEDWLTDAITIKEPTLILKNLSSALVTQINNANNPIHAFLSFRSAITRDNVCPLTDNELAMITKSLVSWYVEYMTAEYNSQLSSGKKMTENAKKAVMEQIEKLKNAKIHLTEFDTDIIRQMPDASQPEANGNVKMLYYFTRGLYYGKQISGKKTPEETYENLAFNVWQTVAEIANLFLPEAQKIEDMGIRNILDLVESVEKDDKGTEEKNSSKVDKKSGNESTKESTGEAGKNA